MSVERKIDQILALPSGQQLEKLCSFVEELVCGENIQHINDFLTYLFNSNISQQVCKQCILHYLKHCSDMVEDARVEINQHIVQLIKNRNISDGYFDEIDKIVRNSLFDYYLLCEDHSLAASYLSGINIESRTVPYSVYDKIDILIKIAECYLMTKDTIEAEIFVNKASNYITDMDNEAMNSKTIDARATVLHLRFRSTHAQVLDGNKKFIDASLKYYELSRVKSHTIDEEDILQLLGKAVTCVILGKISMQRSRILSMLINDPRIHELEALDGYKTHYFLLSKIYKQQIVRENDLMEFESTLDIHQKAVSIHCIYISILSLHFSSIFTNIFVLV